MSPSTLASMERSLARMKIAAENEDTKNYWKQHMIFHEIFIHACGNPSADRSSETPADANHVVSIVLQYYQEDFKNSYRAHEK